MDIETFESWSSNAAPTGKGKSWEIEQLADGGMIPACIELLNRKDACPGWEKWLPHDGVAEPNEAWSDDLLPAGMMMFGGISLSKMMQVHLVCVEYARTEPAANHETFRAWCRSECPEMPAAFLLDLTQALRGGRRSRSCDPVYVAFPVVRNLPTGLIARFMLELLPSGDGEVFLNPEQAFLPLDQDFLDIFKAAPELLNRTVPGRLKGQDVRVTILMHNADRDVLWERGFGGTSGGGALALGLWSLVTAQLLEPRLYPSFALPSIHSSEPGDTCYPIGGLEEKMAGIALKSRQDGPAMFLLAQKQADEIRGDARDMKLTVEGAVTFRDAILIASGRSRLVQYFGTRKKWYSNMRAFGHTLNLERAYLHFRGHTEPAKQYPKGAAEGEATPWDEYMKGRSVAWEDLRSSCAGAGSQLAGRVPPWVVLGNAGAGKTTWLEREAFTTLGEAIHLTENNLGDPVRIPILFKATEVPSSPDLAKFLVDTVLERAGGDERNNETLRTLVQEAWETGRCVLFCDGVDEVDSKNRNNVVNALRIASGRHSVYITCRTSVWNEDSLANAYYFNLEPFTDDDIQLFIEKWFGPDLTQVSERVMGAISTPRMREMARNPLMLTMICAAAHDNPAGNIPNTQTAIVADCWLRQYLRPAQRPDPPTLPGYELCEEALCSLAWNEVENGRPVPGKRAIGLLGRFLLQDMNAPEKMLSEVLVTHIGILTKEQQRGEIPTRYFDFVLPVFSEYFAARHLKGQTDRYAPLLTLLFSKVEWYGILPMLAGCLGDSASELIQQVTEFANKVAFGTADYVEGLTPVLPSRMLVDCLLELKADLSTEVLGEAWIPVLRGIETSQRNLREKEWASLASTDLLAKAVSVAELRMRDSGVSAARRLLEADYQASQDDLQADYQTSRDDLEQLLTSQCPVMRWLAVREIGRSKAWRFSGRVTDLFANDPNPLVKALAARVLVMKNLKLPETERAELIKRIRDSLGDSNCDVAAGAAVALSKEGTEDTLKALLDNADAQGTHRAVRCAVIGALEAVVDKYNRDNKHHQLTFLGPHRDRLAALFLAALKDQERSYGRTVSSAASGLAKLDWKDAIGPLKELALTTKHPRVCSSACFALGRLKAQRVALEVLRARAEDEDEVTARNAFVSTTRDEDGDTVNNALASATRLDQENVAKAVVAICQAIPRERARLFIDAISHHPSKTAVAVAVMLLDLNDDDLANAACRALGDIAQQYQYMLRCKTLEDWKRRQYPILVRQARDGVLRLARDGSRSDQVRMNALIAASLALKNTEFIAGQQESVTPAISWCLSAIGNGRPDLANIAAPALEALAKVLPECFDPEVSARAAMECLSYLEEKPEASWAGALGVLAALMSVTTPGVVKDDALLKSAINRSIIKLGSADVAEQVSSLTLIKHLGSYPSSGFAGEARESVKTFCKNNVTHTDARIRSGLCSTLAMLVRAEIGETWYWDALTQFLKDDASVVRGAAEHELRVLLDKIHKRIQKERVDDAVAVIECWLNLADLNRGPKAAAGAMDVLQALAVKHCLSLDQTERAAEIALRHANGLTGPVLLNSALRTIQRLGFTQYLKEGGENRAAALECAKRHLEKHPDPDVQASAVGVLGYLGNSEHRRLLENLQREKQQKPVEISLNWVLGSRKGKDGALVSSEKHQERLATKYLCPKDAFLGEVLSMLNNSYGFIRFTDVENIFFHKTELQGWRWEDVHEGDVVTFQILEKVDSQRAAKAKKAKNVRKAQPKS